MPSGYVAAFCCQPLLNLAAAGAGDNVALQTAGLSGSAVSGCKGVCSLFQRRQCAGGLHIVCLRRVGMLRAHLRWAPSHTVECPVPRTFCWVPDSLGPVQECACCLQPRGRPGAGHRWVLPLLFPNFHWPLRQPPIFTLVFVHSGLSATAGGTSVPEREVWGCRSHDAGRRPEEPQLCRYAAMLPDMPAFMEA